MMPLHFGAYRRTRMQQDPAQSLTGWQPPTVFNKSTLFCILRVCQHAIAANSHTPCTKLLL